MFNYNFHWYDLIGMIGVGIILIAYLLLQCEKLPSKSYTYTLLNILGSVMILYSLFFEWNLSAVVIEVFWILISLIGLLRLFLKK